MDKYKGHLQISKKKGQAIHRNNEQKTQIEFTEGKIKLSSENVK